MRARPWTCLVAVGFTACTHALEVKNLSTYSAPLRLAQPDPEPVIAVTPWNGDVDALFYYNALVSAIAANPGVKQVQTDYIRSRATGPAPDVVLTIVPAVQYRSSVWNFFINWPGFLIFTPAWHGYEYHADIVTTVDVMDPNGLPLSKTQVPISYDIREAEMDRTIFTGLTWLEYSLLAFGGGIYNANVFDRDIIEPLTTKVRDNYTIYVLNQVNPNLEAALKQQAQPAGQIDAATTTPAEPAAQPTATPP